MVVAENGAVKDGIIDSSNPLVITWAVNTTATVTSRSVSVDGQAVSFIAGPYLLSTGVSTFGGDFGPVTAGVHSFTIASTDSQGETETYNGTFTVQPAQIAISSVVVAAAQPPNGKPEANEQLVLTWAFTDPSTAKTESLTIDGQAVAPIYGPIASQAANTSYFAALFGPESAGTHNYTIQVTDSAGQSTTANGSFTVLPAGIAISDVVVSGTQPPGSMLESNEILVLTWALTGADPAATAAANTQLFIDGTLVPAKYGPFGPTGVNTQMFDWAALFGPLSAGTHNYLIQATDNKGNFDSATGSFNVLAAAALMVDASAPPSGSVPLLSDSQLQPIIVEAEQRLTAATGTEVAAAMTGVSVQIADLPNNMLGEEVGKTIYISPNAAGYGWFVDPTPG